MMALLRIGLLAWTLSVCASATAAPASASEPYAVDRLEMRAQLSPKRYTTLSAELGAKIERITVKEGERFKAGQLLIQFDCALQTAQLDKARAQLAAAENTFGGNRRLAELNAVGLVELKNSETEVMKAKADAAYLRATLDRCRITAPFSGRAGEQKAREQQFVQAGQAMLEILDDSELELEFIVPSRWLTWLNTGHRFTVLIEDTGKSYPARILRIAARADPVSQSVKAMATIDGRYPELVAGMSGRVQLSPAVNNKSK